MARLCLDPPRSLAVVPSIRIEGTTARLRGNPRAAGDGYPHPDYSWARFFHRQEPLKNLRIEKDMWAAMKGIDVLVLGVRHDLYLKLDPDKVVKSAGRPFAVVDCFCVLGDDKIRRYLELGCEVKGMGRGHIKRVKDSIDSRPSAKKAK